MADQQTPETDGPRFWNILKMIQPQAGPMPHEVINFTWFFEGEKDLRTCPT